MPQDVLEQVFEPFFTTKEIGKGTGLGLSMVYGFAKQSGGHVAIESQRGQGTTVTLYLPEAAAGSQIASATRTGDGAAPRGAERILLVEDEPEVRRFVSASLPGSATRWSRPTTVRRRSRSSEPIPTSTSCSPISSFPAA